MYCVVVCLFGFKWKKKQSQRYSHGSLKKRQELREEFFSEPAKRSVTNGYGSPKQTDFDVKPQPTSPSNFSLRNSKKSPFVKEYTYMASEGTENIDQQRRVNPRDVGFSYMDSERPGSPLRSPNSARSPQATSPTSTRPVTGFAFTYKPDSPASLKDSQRSPSKTSPRSPTGRRPPLSATTKTEYATTTPKVSSHSVKSPSSMVSSDERKSKSRSTASKPRTPDLLGSSSGRISRQSRDSKLEGSSSESSIKSSSSSLDEYEKESYVGSIKATKSPSTKSAAMKSPSNRPLISPKPSQSKSPPPPTKPKPSSLFEYQPPSKTSSLHQSQQVTNYNPDGFSGGPKITHASRKRVVTNADGSTIETEEILEPSSMTSHSTTTKTKPVVVGVVPSTQPGTTYTRPDSVFGQFYYSHFFSLLDLTNKNFALTCLCPNCLVSLIVSQSFFGF